MPDSFYPETLIFDADGVVVDTEILWDKSQVVLLARRNLPYNRDYLKPRLAGGSILQGAKIMIEYFGLDESPLSMAAERQDLINQLFEEDVRFMTGFIDFLQFVKSKSLKYCVATSMQKQLMAHVNRKLHLDELFENHIYHIEDVNNMAKPNPDVFLLAAKELKTPPGKCMVIEDSPNGIEAAHRAGMHAAGLATTFNPPVLKQADFIALDFNRLTTYLARLL